MRRTRIVLVDDQVDVVDVLRKGLKDHFRIVGEASSGEELLANASLLKPDVVVLDISMPGMSGVEAAERVKKILPKVKVVMLSVHAADIYVSESFNAGASAYVLKGAGISELVTAIERAQAGEEYLSAGLNRPNKERA